MSKCSINLNFFRGKKLLSQSVLRRLKYDVAELHTSLFSSVDHKVVIFKESRNFKV